MREEVCLDGYMFKLMWYRVEDEEGSGLTSKLEGRRDGSTDRGRMMRRLWWGMAEPNVQLIRAPCRQLRVYNTCMMSDSKGR